MVWSKKRFSKKKIKEEPTTYKKKWAGKEIKVGKEPTIYQRMMHMMLENKLPDVKIEMEKWDGHKHIDIAIVKARLNIEVDGAHHNLSLRQALSDIKREYYSVMKGYYTLHIPNTLIKDQKATEEVVDMVVGIVKERLVGKG